MKLKTPIYNPQLENYCSRLKEVLEVTGKLTADDLNYCKLLTQNEDLTEQENGNNDNSLFSVMCERVMCEHPYADVMGDSETKPAKCLRCGKYL